MRALRFLSKGRVLTVTLPRQSLANECVPSCRIPQDFRANSSASFDRQLVSQSSVLLFAPTPSFAVRLTSPPSQVTACAMAWISDGLLRGASMPHSRYMKALPDNLASLSLQVLGGQCRSSARDGQSVPPSFSSPSACTNNASSTFVRTAASPPAFFSDIQHWVSRPVLLLRLPRRTEWHDLIMDKRALLE